jgi:hypothetical protein
VEWVVAERTRRGGYKPGTGGPRGVPGVACGHEQFLAEAPCFGVGFRLFSLGHWLPLVACQSLSIVVAIVLFSWYNK